MIKLNVNYEKVESSVHNIKNIITKDDIESKYNAMISRFTDSKGKEADALRNLLKAERNLTKQMNKTLNLFATNIQFASNELKNLDKAGSSAIAAEIAASDFTTRSKN